MSIVRTRNTAANLHAQVKSLGIQGPKTATLLTLLEELTTVLDKRAQDKPPKQRPPTPAGSFTADRGKRTLTVDGHTFPALTIARGVCAVFDFEVTTGHVFEDQAIAAAVQAAFPENSYKVYRVLVDRQKHARNLFKFQQV